MEIGQIYNVNSQRKGKFTGQLVSFDDTWATFTILKGVAKAMLDYNVKHEGEDVTCRRELCQITECNHDTKTAHPLLND